jgi:hypothetical protein
MKGSKLTEAFQQRVMELMSDPLFTKNMGKALPQAEPYKALGDGFGNISGQAFPETCSCLCQNPEVFGPQGEPLFRFSEDQPRDPDGKFASGSGSMWKKEEDEPDHVKKFYDRKHVAADKVVVDQHVLPHHVDAIKDAMSSGTKFDVATAVANGDGTYTVEDGSHRVTAAKNLGEETIPIRVMKEDSRSFNPEQPRDKSGVFSMGNVAKFESEEKGLIAYVTKFEGKFHVNVLKAGQPCLPGAIYSDKQQAIDKAKELLAELKVKPVTGQQ